MRVAVQMAMLCASVMALAGCSKPPAADVLKKAQEMEETSRKALDTMRVKPDLKGFFSPVIEEYSRLVDKYEGDPEAEVALFHRAVLLGNDLKEHEGAVADYRLYAERYPAREKTPMVMFLIGYIYNNELHNLDSAGAAYRRFLARYPEHEMASSARYELDNLGKSPEELILQEPPAEKPAVKGRARTGA